MENGKGNEGVQHTENKKGLNAQTVGAEACQQGPYGKACIAAYGKDSHGPPFHFAGNTVHHKGRFRMEEGASHAAAEGRREKSHVASRKSHRRNRKAADKTAQGYEPGPGNPVGVVAKYGLHDGGDEHIGKDKHARLLIGKAIVGDEVGQKSRYGPLGPVGGQMPESEEID